LIANVERFGTFDAAKETLAGEDTPGLIAYINKNIVST
jgi:hypothetical protein